jgi:hypothetical protein
VHICPTAASLARRFSFPKGWDESAGFFVLLCLFFFSRSFRMPVPTTVLATGTNPDRFPSALVDVSGVADLTWVRDGVDYAHFYVSEDDPEVRGDMIRTVLEIIGPSIDSSDVLVAKGEAQFGQTPLQLPSCVIMGYGPSHTLWRSTARIDTPGGPGFLSGTSTTVRDMYLGNVSYDPHEDSSCIGFHGDTGARTLTLERCVIDGSQSCDWTIYNWTNGNTLVVRDCDIASCRMAIAAAYSGGGSQSVTVERTRFYLDANNSESYGASSGLDPDSGGVLAGVVIRRGDLTVTDAEFHVTGLSTSYNVGWGCPRVALITDQYYSTSGPRTITLDGIYVKEYTPGIESVANVLDFRNTSPSSSLTIVENDLRPASGLPAWP